MVIHVIQDTDVQDMGVPSTLSRGTGMVPPDTATPNTTDADRTTEPIQEAVPMAYTQAIPGPIPGQIRTVVPAAAS